MSSKEKLVDETVKFILSTQIEIEIVVFTELFEALTIFLASK